MNLASCTYDYRLPHSLRSPLIFSIACESAGSITERFSRTARGLPGRFTIRVCRLIPATALEIMACGVFLRLSGRMAPAMPGSSRSITSRLAWGVPSLGETPVPPVVMMRSIAPDPASRVSASTIRSFSSGRSSAWLTVTPAPARISRMSLPLSSTRSPAAPLSLKVIIAARIIPLPPDFFVNDRCLLFWIVRTLLPVHHHRVSSRMFRLIQRFVRGLDELVGRAGAIGRNTDADRNMQRARMSGKYRVLELLPECLRLVPGPLNMRIRHDNGKFLASVPGDRVRFAHAFLEEPGDLTQDRIADNVSMNIVQFFEMVDVDHHEREIRILATVIPLYLFIEQFVEITTIIDLRKAVGDGDLGKKPVGFQEFGPFLLKFVFRLDPVRDIPDHPHDIRNAPLFDDRRTGAVQVPLLTVCERDTARMLARFALFENIPNALKRTGPLRHSFERDAVGGSHFLEPRHQGIRPGIALDDPHVRINKKSAVRHGIKHGLELGPELHDPLMARKLPFFFKIGLVKGVYPAQHVHKAPLQIRELIFP